MTQNEKDLLLKDLCSRLDTNLVCSIYRTDDEGVGYRDEILHGYCKGDVWYEFYFREDCSIGIDDVSKIKPYLFPLSSMTEEQKRDYYSLADDVTIKPGQGSYFGIKIHCIKLGISDNPHEGVWDDVDLDAIDWLNKNHFDYRGLIPMGLAIDATELNIY